MTIESNLERIAALLSRIADALEQKTTAPAPAPAHVPTPEPVVAPAPAPVPAPAPAPAPVPSTVVAPFTDTKGLMDYVMTKYKSLGPIKGGMIQQVLLDLGHSNMSNVPASQYADFYLKVEAL